MMERALLTPDELKSIPRQLYRHENRHSSYADRLRLFLDWGIKVWSAIHRAGTANRTVDYASRVDLERNLPKADKAEEASSEHQLTPYRDTGGCRMTLCRKKQKNMAKHKVDGRRKYMSYFGTIYADTELPSRARAVYMYLRDRADAEGKCMARHQTIRVRYEALQNHSQEGAPRPGTARYT